MPPINLVEEIIIPDKFPSTDDLLNEIKHKGEKIVNLFSKMSLRKYFLSKIIALYNLEGSKIKIECCLFEYFVRIFNNLCSSIVLINSDMFYNDDKDIELFYLLILCISNLKVKVFS